MKKTLCVVAGLATVGLAVWLGSRLWAQAPGAARPTTATVGASKSKVAIINLKYVITNYQRYKDFQNESKGQFTSYETRLKPLGEKIEAIKKEMQANPNMDAAMKEVKQKEFRNYQRQIEDIQQEMQATLGKKESDQFVLLYKEVGAAVSHYAQSHDLDLVLQYADAVSDAEMNSQTNILQKLQNRAAIPLYWGQGVDISAQVLEMLNQRYKPSPAVGGNTQPVQPRGN